jgi:hypothetical protein
MPTLLQVSRLTGYHHDMNGQYTEFSMQHFSQLRQFIIHLLQFKASMAQEAKAYHSSTQSRDVWSTHNCECGRTLGSVSIFTPFLGTKSGTTTFAAAAATAAVSVAQSGRGMLYTSALRMAAA